MVVLLTGCGKEKDVLTRVPEENRFKKTVITEDLTSPMTFEIPADGRIYLIESGGTLKIIDPGTGQAKIAGKLKVFNPTEHGLIGMALDPDFLKNGWIYFQYGIPSDKRDSVTFQVSRFTLVSDSIDFASEKKLVEIPYVYACCHTAGSMAFDSKGNLYFSTGDNTSAFETSYSPSDDRVGHEIGNALRSAANSSDLRGKILRIHPEPDGTYTIPGDNLFADGMNGRPEIYVMGCRNPFRIFVDKTTDILYWGEVGPDAEKDSTKGPNGYDEFNIAKKAGFYGWPLFIGNNKAYKKVNFETGEILYEFDAERPINTSRLNSGVKDLPPAQPATIWYTYNLSTDFPSFGVGGRTAIGGPLYHFNPASASTVKFPEYFDGAWFIADWMRNWIKIVHFDAEDKIVRIGSLMPFSTFKKPIHMSFGDDGVLYLAEYGSNWFNNTDARLIKVEYISGNRTPVAEISPESEYGTLPFTVKLDAGKSADPDGDSLRYKWSLENGTVVSEEQHLTHKIEEAGKQRITLTVSDASGEQDTASISVYAGNSKPLVKIELPNEIFYWESLSYTVQVTDAEDGVLGKEIPSRNVSVELTPMTRNTVSSGSNGNILHRGEVLINESDCKACHALNSQSVGPSFEMVSSRYENHEGNISMLAEKILRGGSGSWGDQVMAPHPQLTKNQTVEMARYILSLTKPDAPARKIEVQGTISFLWDNLPAGRESNYLLSASYTDKGNQQIAPLKATARYMLRYPKFYPDDFEDLFEANIRRNRLVGRTGSYFRLSDIDLSNIRQVVLKCSGEGTIELRLDGIEGPLLAQAEVNSGEDLNIIPVTVSGHSGKKNLYFIRKNERLRFNEYAVEWVYFSNTIKKNYK